MNARNARAATEAPTQFNHGLAKEAEAAKLANSNHPDQATEAYWEATSSFASAATQGRQVTAAKNDIENVLKRFQSGYVQKNAGAILAAYPTADTDGIFKSLKSCSKLTLTFRDIRIDLLPSGEAQADVTSVYGCQPKTGQDELPSKPVQDTFRLARKNDSWVIVNWLVPLQLK